ncbi:MAG: protein-disulfide reductase DsbD family protein [Chitinophagaceae bacterium]
MKKIFLPLFTFCFSLFAFSQDSLVWKIAAKKIADSTYQISAKTSVTNGWHLYGDNASIEELKESDVKFIFQLENIKPINTLSFNKKPEVIKDVLFENKNVNVYTSEIEVKQDIKINGFIPATAKLSINGFIGKEAELIPLLATEYEIALEGGVAANNENTIKKTSIDVEHPLSQCGDKKAEGGIWTIFFLGVLGGLIALLTPCVFPMIPVTVSFFTKRSKTKQEGIKNGFLYGFFIFLIYVLASTPFHIIGNVQPEIFNNISTNPWLNVAFFAIFIFFSISFFGYFEISLPHSIAGKADSKGSLGSIFGIFFMALTLVIVSFSCTGVILGTLLVGTSSGGAWALTAGMAGFGVALGLPFALFAIFPNWLQSLPKSGGWLDTVKKVLAFVEVAMALKFLSNADLVEHWGLLKREVFIGLWLAVAIGLALYAFGILRLPHDYKGQKISTGRKIIGFVAIALAIYLVPGVTNSKYASLKLLSGFPPPFSYSVYGETNINNKGLEPDFINDYDKALALAKQQHKPLLIDCTGWACVNCRKMEENIWIEPSVYKFIKENFILVSLYVDDKAKLPVDKRIMNYKTNDGNTKDIITIGDKYATFESENFNQVSQPLYAMVDNNEKLLAYPIGATFDAAKYLAWLQCGKKTFDGK